MDSMDLPELITTDELGPEPLTFRDWMTVHGALTMLQDVYKSPEALESGIKPPKDLPGTIRRVKATYEDLGQKNPEDMIEYLMERFAQMKEATPPEG